MIDAFGDFVDLGPIKQEVESDDDEESKSDSLQNTRWKEDFTIPTVSAYIRTEEGRPEKNYFSCGVFEKIQTKEKWHGKSDYIEEDDNSRIFAQTQRVASDIYNLYGVVTPKIELSVENPINCAFPHMENNKAYTSVHIMTEIIPEFESYKKACGKKLKLTGMNTDDWIQLKTKETLKEKGLGAILAVGLFINDKNTIGRNGCNVGFIKKSNAGKGAVQSVKVDPFEPFDDLDGNESLRNIPISCIQNQKPETVTFESLNKRVRDEFIATVKAIVKTDEKVFKELFARKGLIEFITEKEDIAKKLIERQKKLKSTYEKEF